MYRLLFFFETLMFLPVHHVSRTLVSNGRVAFLFLLHVTEISSLSCSKVIALPSYHTSAVVALFCCVTDRLWLLHTSIHILVWNFIRTLSPAALTLVYKSRTSCLASVALNVALYRNIMMLFPCSVWTVTGVVT